MVKSNSMERTEFYGHNAEDDRRNFRQVMRVPMISQSTQQVADAIYDAVTSKRSESVVGLPFAVAAQAYNMTGINVSALPFM